jgi:hypothetical protein
MTRKSTKSSTKRNLYVLVGVLIVASITLRFLSDINFEQSSILFIGLPALITLLMIKYTKTPKNAYGVVFRVITLFFLMSSIVLGEGIVCILFSAPLFYGVAALVVFISEYLKKKNKEKLLSLVIAPVLLIISQPFDIKVAPEVQVVETFVTINKDVSIDAFNNSPDVLKNYPAFFKIGFPKPLGIKGTGTNVGDSRDIQFESNTKGIGTLSLEVIEKNETSITFKPTKDDTHIDHWLTWNEMKIEIIESGPNQSTIKWTSQYQCDLGPRWYFEPLEEITVGVMNKHLIDVYFN